MSGNPDLAQIYSDICESARLLDVACSREKVWPVLTAYEDVLARAVIAFRVATSAKHAGDFDYRFMILPNDVDPYARAVAHGLITERDHPVSTLLSDVARQFPVDTYGADFGVVGGFKKTYTFFPADDMQHLADLAKIPSMPRAVAENLGFFDRRGLAERISLVGVDYRSATMNLYFGEIPPENFQRSAIESSLRELGLPAPSERLLAMGEQAFGIYVTLNWESPRVERICYAVMTTDPLSLPVPMEPKIEQFVRTTQRDAEAGRFVYAATLSGKEEYYKLQSYYKWQPQILDVMLLSDDASAAKA